MFQGVALEEQDVSAIEVGQQAVEVSIDVRREAGGFLSALVYRPDGDLIVMTPPCDTQEGALAVAKAMWTGQMLALPPGFDVVGHA